MGTATISRPIEWTAFRPGRHRSLDQGYNNGQIIRSASHAMALRIITRFPDELIILTGAKHSGLTMMAAVACALAEYHRESVCVHSERIDRLEAKHVIHAPNTKLVYVDDCICSGTGLSVCFEIWKQVRTIDFGIVITSQKNKEELKILGSIWGTPLDALKFNW